MFITRWLKICWLLITDFKRVHSISYLLSAYLFHLSKTFYAPSRYLPAFSIAYILVHQTNYYSSNLHTCHFNNQKINTPAFLYTNSQPASRLFLHFLPIITNLEVLTNDDATHQICTLARNNTPIVLCGWWCNTKDREEPGCQGSGMHCRR